MYICAGLQPFGPKHQTQSKFAGLWKAEKKFKLVNFNYFAFYTTNSTLVCVLSYISSAVTLFCGRAEISATVKPIGVKFCKMVELCPGQCFSPFGGDIFRCHQTRGYERARVNHFWPLRHHLLPFTSQRRKRCR